MYDFNAYGKLKPNLDFIQDFVTAKWNTEHLNFSVFRHLNQNSKRLMQKMYNGGMTGASQTSIMAFQCYHFTPKLFCTVAWSIHLLQQNERKYSQMSTLQASIPTQVLITLSQSWCCLLKAFKLYKEQDKRFLHFSKKKKILSIFCVNNFCCFSEQRLKKHSIS